jgi:type VI protein secretion system component VasF
MNSETHLQDLLSAVTDALLAGDRNLDAIISRYQVSRPQVEALVTIIRRLHVTLVGAQPSQQFVRRLKYDLMGEPAPNVITRIRRLPPRVQIAAGIALLAGFMLLQRRRMQEFARQEGRVQVEATPVR